MEVGKKEQIPGFNLWRERRRRLIFRAIILGLVVGSVAILFQFLLHETENLNQHLASFFKKSGVLGYLIFPVICSLIAAVAGLITSKYAPEASGSGIPHTKGVIAGLYKLRPFRIIFVKIIAGVLAIASGMSLGREGPTVQIVAACGRIMCDLFQVSKRSFSLLIAVGAGSGLAAAFNAPLAGFLFVMEELKREMSAATYATALLTSICAVAVSRLIYGQNPSFILDDPGLIPLSTIPLVIVLGAFGGALGVFFNKLTLKLIRTRIKLSIPTYYLASGAGFLSGVLLLFLPEITGGGHSLTQNLLAGSQVHANGSGMSFALMFAKLIFTSICFAMVHQSIRTENIIGIWQPIRFL